MLWVPQHPRLSDISVNPGLNHISVNPGLSDISVNPGHSHISVNPGLSHIWVNPRLTDILVNPGDGPYLRTTTVGLLQTTFAYEFVYIEKKNYNFTGKSFAMLSPPVNSKSS